MNTSVYVINGPGRSGKNTFIRMCRLFLRKSSYQIYSLTSIFPIKKYMIDKGIWDGKSEKTTAIRRQMAEIKKQMSEDGDQPNQYLVDEIKTLLDVESIVFVHIREADSISRFLELLKEQTGIQAKTIHYARRDGSLEEFQSGVDLESQTREFENYDFDIIIDKFGLEYVRDVAKAFLFGEFTELPVTDFDLEMIDDIQLHREFNDELRAELI